MDLYLPSPFWFPPFFLQGYLSHNNIRLLGLAGHSISLCPTILYHTPDSLPISLQGPVSNKFHAPRDIISIGVGCHIADTTCLQRKRILVCLLYDTKEKGRVATYSRSQAPQQLYVQSKALHGDSGIHHTLIRSYGLV